ncbi:hypothetical protein WA1_48110 [Scytonema hofmannii PCC 7110]|uniref:Shikimate dehydrogenase n=1 Tax=Scytonema hofmannii PCC 7110 TaxID=128403 RepID=A0A139WY54_9CYAN|nr:hypothetical protein [Scytonema hofmannii]KYC37377.1 hypothetical protein WA1_48110 [Scytonema hofmannii PCC 7110]
MSQSPITVTYSLEEVLKQINQKLDNLQKDVNDFRTETKVAIESVKGDIKNIDTRLTNLEKTVDEIKVDTKKNTTDLADLKGWRSLIAPFFVAVVVAAITGLINWAIKK